MIEWKDDAHSIIQYNVNASMGQVAILEMLARVVHMIEGKPHPVYAIGCFEIPRGARAQRNRGNSFFHNLKTVMGTVPDNLVATYVITTNPMLHALFIAASRMPYTRNSRIVAAATVEEALEAIEQEKLQFTTKPMFNAQ